MRFRKEEIKVSIGYVFKTGVTLLADITSVAAMNKLDEMFGGSNWTNGGMEINTIKTGDVEKVFAVEGLRVYDSEKDVWICNLGIGLESETLGIGYDSYTQGEFVKELESKAFVGACKQFGIGIEIDTAPHMWVPAETEVVNNHYTLSENSKEKFRGMYVDKITYDEDDAVNGITIKNPAGETLFEKASGRK